jgi:hypothetical protein
MGKARTTKRKRLAPPRALARLGDELLESLRAGPGRRTKIVNFLVSGDELEEMRATAKALDLTLSAYLRGLHRAAVAALRRKRRGRRHERGNEP